MYTEKSRKKKIQDTLDVTSHPPSLAELFAIWWNLAAQKGEAKYLEEYTDTSSRRLMGQIDLEKYYKKPIWILNQMVPALIKECPKISGISERCDFRANLYLTTWEKLFAYIKFWPIDSSDKFLQARKKRSAASERNKKITGLAGPGLFRKTGESHQKRYFTGKTTPEKKRLLKKQRLLWRSTLLCFQPMIM